MALDLNIFPSYNGDQVRFVTAQPGEQGASKVTIQLGSITDQQVRATSKVPGAKADMEIADLSVDKATRKRLRTLGVTSVSDLKAIEQKNVDLRKVSENEVDYTKLANQIQKSTRDQARPDVSGVSFSLDEDSTPCLLIEGSNIAIDPTFVPVAVVNQKLADVRSSSDRFVRIELGPDHNITSMNELILTFDPFAVVKLNVRV